MLFFFCYKSSEILDNTEQNPNFPSQDSECGHYLLFF